MPDGFNHQPKIVRTLDDLPTEMPVFVVRPRKRESVPARLAQADGSIAGPGGGALHYRADQHYIVEHRNGEVSIVRRDIFEKTYHRVQPGLYRKRHNLRLRAAIADEPVQVETLEGLKPAARGDWIMIGVADELWPVPASTAKEAYREAAAVSVSSTGVVVLLVFLLLTFVALMSI